MRLFGQWERHPAVRLVVLGILVPTAAYLAFRGVLFDSPQQVELTAEQIQARQDSALGPEDHLIAAFVSSSFCGANSQDGFVEGVRSLMAEIEEFGARSDFDDVVTVGVSIDPEAQTGLEYLEQFGEFDEVVSGANWLNTGSIRYLLETRAEMAVPQVVLIARSIDRGRQSLRITGSRTVGVLQGADQIMDGLADIDFELRAGIEENE